MRKSVLAVVGIAVAIIIVGFVIKGQRGSTPPGIQSSSETNPTGTLPEKKRASRPQPPVYDPQNISRPVRTNTSSNTGFVTAPTNPPTFMTNWEEKLDNILTSD